VDEGEGGAGGEGVVECGELVGAWSWWEGEGDDAADGDGGGDDAEDVEGGPDESGWWAIGGLSGGQRHEAPRV